MKDLIESLIDIVKSLMAVCYWAVCSVFSIAHLISAVVGYHFFFDFWVSVGVVAAALFLRATFFYCVGAYMCAHYVFGAHPVIAVAYASPYFFFIMIPSALHNYYRALWPKNN